MDPQTAAVAAKAANAAVEEAKGLIGKFLGPACAELGETLADYVRVFRLKKQIGILRKAREMLGREGLTPKAVSLKTFVPLLEAGALDAFAKACRGNAWRTEAFSVPSDTAKTVHHTIDTTARWS